MKQQPTNYQGSLAGINVIDFGHYYAGPMAAMHLADQGANVIRIVKPGGSTFRDSTSGESELPKPQSRLFNRNKKLLTLDLKSAEGKARALALIERADVVIENFRPGVMQRLGLDYAAVKKTNPGIIYLSLPGFSSRDKEHAHIQAWEGILSAASGVFTSYSMIREFLNYPPLYTSIAHCSAYGANHGAVAVMAALLAREQYGCGTAIEVPLIEAGLSGFTQYFVTNSFPQAGFGRPAANDNPYIYSPTDSRAEQEEKIGKAWRSLLVPDSRWHLTADGRKLEFWGSVVRYHAESFYQGLGIYKQLLHEGFVAVGPWEYELDNNLNTPWLLSPERAQRLEELLSETIGSKTLAEWEDKLSNTITNTIRTREEWLALESNLISGLIVKMDNGQSVLSMPGRLGDVSGPGGALIGGYREGEAVTFNEAIELLGNPKEEKAAPQSGQKPLRKGDLLRGLKVLDLANVMATPMSGYILAQYGAEVITGAAVDGVFPQNIMSVLEANMGKRSILTDTRTAPGREILQRLIARSDVVVHNVLDVPAQRLGVTHDQLLKINPEVTSCQVTAWGGTWRGGREGQPGVDMGVQAETGLEAQYCGMEWPQYVGNASVVDAVSASAAAFTTLLGVWQKRTTGYSGEGRTSLARGNSHFQLPWMIAENGRCDWGDVSGQVAKGENWWQRMYNCRDGWIYVGTHQKRADVLLETALGEKDFPGGDQEKEVTLESALVKETCAYWLERFNNADIACHKVLDMRDICAVKRPVDNEEANEIAHGGSEILCWEDHPGGTPVSFPAPSWVRVGENHSYLRCKPAPRRGQHTREILRELGYTDTEIQQLIDLRVSLEYQPEHGPDAYYYKPLFKGQ